MFTAGMLESQTNRVDIAEGVGKSYAVLKRLMYFFYTNKLEEEEQPKQNKSAKEKEKENDGKPNLFGKVLNYVLGKEDEEIRHLTEEKPDELLELLSVSEFYSLPYLKFLCETRLATFLDVDTVVYVLHCAKMYRAFSLEANCKGNEKRKKMRGRLMALSIRVYEATLVRTQKIQQLR